MQNRNLGQTGLRVSELGLGGLFLASQGAEHDRSQVAALRAFEMGINYVDTAPGYGNSEEVVGGILRYVEEPIIVSTKLGGRPQPFEPSLGDYEARCEMLFGAICTGTDSHIVANIFRCRFRSPVF